jgi:uncharacterized membrane protein
MGSGTSIVSNANAIINSTGPGTPISTFGTVVKGYLVYSFLGWTAESIKNWNDDEFISCNPVFKHLFSKDVCWLPFPPAYGLGGVFLGFLWKYFPNMHWITVAIISAILFNVIELIGGYLGEKYLCGKISTCQEGKKMWNYTKGPNIGGHIDLEHTFYWVILGLIGYYTYNFIMGRENTSLFGIFVIVWAIITVHKLRQTDVTDTY